MLYFFRFCFNFRAEIVLVITFFVACWNQNIFLTIHCWLDTKSMFNLHWLSIQVCSVLIAIIFVDDCFGFSIDFSRRPHQMPNLGHFGSNLLSLRLCKHSFGFHVLHMVVRLWFFITILDGFKHKLDGKCTWVIRLLWKVLNKTWMLLD